MKNDMLHIAHRRVHVSHHNITARVAAFAGLGWAWLGWGLHCTALHTRHYCFVAALRAAVLGTRLYSTLLAIALALAFAEVGRSVASRG